MISQNAVVDWPGVFLDTNVRYESAVQQVADEDRGRRAKRFWARHKTQAVLRLLRGEDIDLVSRELGVTAATLSLWRNISLETGESGLKPHPVKESQKLCKRPWLTVQQR